jgi:hypothetical protein
VVSRALKRCTWLALGGTGAVGFGGLLLLMGSREIGSTAPRPYRGGREGRRIMGFEKSG